MVTGFWELIVRRIPYQTTLPRMQTQEVFHQPICARTSLHPRCPPMYASPNNGSDRIPHSRVSRWSWIFTGRWLSCLLDPGFTWSSGEWATSMMGMMAVQWKPVGPLHVRVGPERECGNNWWKRWFSAPMFLLHNAEHRSSFRCRLLVEHNEQFRYRINYRLKRFIILSTADHLRAELCSAVWYKIVIN